MSSSVVKFQISKLTKIMRFLQDNRIFMTSFLLVVLRGFASNSSKTAGNLAWQSIQFCLWRPKTERERSTAHKKRRFYACRLCAPQTGQMCSSGVQRAKPSLPTSLPGTDSGSFPPEYREATTTTTTKVQTFPSWVATAPRIEIVNARGKFSTARAELHTLRVLGFRRRTCRSVGRRTAWLVWCCSLGSWLPARSGRSGERGAAGCVFASQSV